MHVSARIVLLGLALAVAPAAAPAALDVSSVTWVGVVRDAAHPTAPGVPVRLVLTSEFPVVSGTLTARPPFQAGCDDCPFPCSPLLGTVIGTFAEGGYFLEMLLPTKDLSTCETLCFSTLTVALDFHPDGSLTGTGLTQECSNLFEDTVTAWRLVPQP